MNVKRAIQIARMILAEEANTHPSYPSPAERKEAYDVLARYHETFSSLENSFSSIATTSIPGR